MKSNFRKIKRKLCRHKYGVSKNKGYGIVRTCSKCGNEEIIVAY